MRNWMILILSILVFVSCKSKSRILTTGYIVGTDDIGIFNEDDKSVPAQVIQAGKSVHLIIISAGVGAWRFCSGWFVKEGEGPTWVVANHHCFAKGGDGEKNMVTEELLPSHCSGLKVLLDDDKMLTCKEGTFSSDLDLDLAKFQVNEVNEIPPLRLAADEDVPTDRPVVVVHFPNYPPGEAKHMEHTTAIEAIGVRGPRKQVSIADCAAMGTYPPGFWRLDRSLGFGLKHTCDLLKGSSGSPIVDATTGLVLAANWGGIKLKYADPPRTEVANVGTRAKFVRAFLLGKHEQEKQFVKAVAGGSATNSSDATTVSAENTARKSKGCGTIVGVQGAHYFLFLIPLLLWIRHET